MSDYFVGEIRNFGFAKVPQGWAACNGQLLTISDHTALYSLLGTAYGGDGVRTFGLPDLRGRVIAGMNPADHQYALGATGGAEEVTLTPAQLPAHNHSFQVRAETGTAAAIANNFASSAGGTPAQSIYAAPGNNPIPLNPESLGTFGNSLPHSNIQPYLVTNYCIATNGIYPPRS